LPGERDNARNNARCTQASKSTHGLDGQHQDVDRTPPVEESIRMTKYRDNGESTSTVWPTLKNRTVQKPNVKVPNNKTEQIKNEN